MHINSYGSGGGDDDDAFYTLLSADHDRRGARSHETIHQRFTDMRGSRSKHTSTVTLALVETLKTFLYRCLLRILSISTLFIYLLLLYC